MVEVNSKRRSGNTCFLLCVFFFKSNLQSKVCNLTPIVVKFQYSLLHHFTHLQHRSPGLYPVFTKSSTESNSMACPHCFGACLTWLICLPLTLKRHLCRSAATRLTSTFLTPECTELLPVLRTTYAPTDHPLIRPVVSNHRKQAQDLHSEGMRDAEPEKFISALDLTLLSPNFLSPVPKNAYPRLLHQLSNIYFESTWTKATRKQSCSWDRTLPQPLGILPSYAAERDGREGEGGS